MLLSDAIAAVSTFADRPAAAASALIRISAPDLSHIAAAFLRTSTNEPIDLARRAAFRGRFILPPLREPSLPVLVINLPANSSFTGQPTLEFIIPGSPTLVSRILNTILAQPNARRAEPGEFAARAYALGRLTLAQAEGLAAFISASTDAQLRSAKAVLSGSLGAHALDWHARVSRLLALVEAGIDFTDQEDVRAIDTPGLIAALEELLHEITAHLGITRSASASTPPIHPSSLAAHAPPTVLLLGPPSAGKSTLFNALLGRTRALTDEAPGTTRDLLRERLTIHAPNPPRNRSVTLTLTDAPGLDAAFSVSRAHSDAEPRTHAEILSRAQARAIDTARDAALVIWCSSTDNPADVPAELINAVNPQSIIRVRTKLDRAGVAIDARAVRDRNHPNIIGLCSLTGHNVDLLRSAIFDSLWSRSHTGSTLDLLPRHHAALSACFAALNELHAELIASDADAHPELIAHTLRTALDALAPLTGRVERDETLGLIFSTFCIGK